MSYSVIIRTLTGGGKYQRLLDSINKQSIHPEHVYVIQPIDANHPKERIGYEEYLHTKKGMWNQRIYGMEYCYSQKNHSKFLLVCDDDIEFESDFVEKLIEIAKSHNADTLSPIPDFKNTLRKNLILKLLGERTENRTSPYKITLKKNGRYSVNNELKSNVNPTQSAPFQCFLMRTDITPILKLREEMWLDETRYAWPDDQVFFYKAHLSGCRTLSCKNPVFRHLDGKSGLSDRQREHDSTYSHARNSVIFWNRFIKPSQRTYLSQILSHINFQYYILVNKLLALIKGIINRDFTIFNYYSKGITDGYKFLKS